MSLIHKALQKAQGSASTPPATLSPEEAFVQSERRRGGRRSTLLVLCGFLMVAMTVAGYRWYSARTRPTATAAVPMPIIPTFTQAEESALPGAPGTERLMPPGVAAFEGTALPDVPAAVAELVSEGEALYQAGRFKEALAKFQEAGAQVPEAALIWNNIGLTQKKIGNVEAAQSAYQKALELAPAYPEAMNNLGTLYVAKGDRLAAALLFRRAIEMNADYPDAHFNLAVLMEEEGIWRSAVEEYKTFLDLLGSDDVSLREQVVLRVEDLTP